MENVKAFLIFIAVVTFIMFLVGVPGAIGITFSAVFFLILGVFLDNDDSNY